MTTTPATMTFEHLARRQPALLALREYARSGRHLDGWERERHWADMKSGLRRLVGFHADLPLGDVLGTTLAYDCVYRELQEALGA
jgi:hypothetical protein